MLAPPFTRENAADNARKATISRERNRAARKAEFLASDDATPIKRAKVQVNRVLAWMEKCKDKAEYARLVAMLDRLWPMAYPKQASVKSKPQRRSYFPAPIVGFTDTPPEPSVQ